MAQGKSTTSNVLRLLRARLSFPRVFEAKAFREGQTPRFEATFLLDPSDAKHADIIKEVKNEAKRISLEKWNGKIPRKLETCFGLADEDGIEYDGYEGMFYLRSSNRTRPVVVDRDKSVLVESDGRIYAGCIVNGTITLWAQDNEFGKRINANLRGVQFVKDAKSFGVKPVDAEDEFDDIEDDEPIDEYSDEEEEDNDDPFK